MHRIAYYCKSTNKTYFYPNKALKTSLCLFNELWIDIDKPISKLENKTHHTFEYINHRNNHKHLKICFKNSLYVPGLIDDLDELVKKYPAINNLTTFLSFNVLPS